MQNFHNSSHSYNVPKVNLLNNQDNYRPRSKKIFKLSRFVLYLFSIVTIAFFVFSYQVIFTSNSLTDVFSGKASFFKQLQSLAGDGGNLKGTSDNRINILLLGIGGAGHDGPYLTDTIILASIQPDTNKVAMISIPRDLQVEIPGYGWWKINNANAFGENTDPGNGGSLAKATAEKAFNIPIHYYVRIDFSGFEKVIDTLDGVKVNVEKSFSDDLYPTDNYLYQTVSFNAGLQTMDGDTALKYARSRHGNNGEGSDFARSTRQQIIISAVKQRLLSTDFLLSPRKIKNFIEDLASHLKTDMESWEAIEFAKLAGKLDTSSIATVVLDDSPDGLLTPNMVNGAYVLQPKGEDFSLIQSKIKNIFAEPKALAEIALNSPASVEIKNGTTIAGLASLHAQELKLANFKVLQIGNAPIQNYLSTEIYLLSDRELKAELGKLETRYQTTIIKNTVPAWIRDMAAPELDFFIVLGEDAQIKP